MQGGLRDCIRAFRATKCAFIDNLRSAKANVQMARIMKSRAVFESLQDRTVRETLRFLEANPGATNIALARQFGMSPVAAFKRLAWLRQNGLVQSTRQGAAMKNVVTKQGVAWQLGPPLLTTRQRVQEALEADSLLSRRQLAKSVGRSIATVQYHLEYLRRRR